MKFKKAVMTIAAMAFCSTAAFADYLDLTSGGGGTFGQGIYLDAGANVGTVGTGNIDSFVRIQTSGSEEGYNTSGRPVPFDENTSLQFTHDIQLKDLFVFPTPGNGIPAGNYYRFLLDINQEGSAPLLSLDKIRLYYSATEKITSDTFAGMTLLWDIDGGGDTACGGLFDNATCDASQTSNGALLNYGLNNGSGNGLDAFLWVPTTLFANLSQDSYIYLYSAFGELGGAWASNDGFEEWARDAVGPTTPPPPPPPVPEPASLIMLGLGLTGLVAGKRLAGKIQ
jgi:hypothetical protein